MNTITTNKPPIWFWIINILALIWNLLGVAAYLSQVYMDEETHAALTEAELKMYENLPVWYTAIFAIAVFSGTLGCIALLLRKKWAYPVFLVGAIAVCIQMAYVAFSLKMANVMTILIIIVAFALVWYTKQANKKGWLQ
ncbi:hypothetical protein KO494_03495 [Lacinutrix sp. C3R15]|uniref:hypothetical protein n=1 Tax=Flavobacteriaceae TaxID=49546 RepID=UPI001C09AC9F|nr:MULTISPECIES: hypothetical protein [Flavobacteriaceae]MBU2938597.1 hypothetical protein [Lacinutrix sp. C3R15]MDO6621911.1 hypothetical protein [Oceanihabitans sp. 1_MG-2023]